MKNQLTGDAHLATNQEQLPKYLAGNSGWIKNKKEVPNIANDRMYGIFSMVESLIVIVKTSSDSEAIFASTEAKRFPRHLLPE